MSVIPWFKVDDNLAFHAKTVAAGNPAMGLWVRAGSWSAQQLTDGFIPHHILAAIGTKSQAERLVSVRLWDRVEGGYRFHEWAERQPSKVDVKAEQAAARDRMRAYRARRKGTAKEDDSQVSDESSPERSDEQPPNEQECSPEVRQPRPDPVPVPTRPDPINTYDLASSVGASLVVVPPKKTTQTLIGEWIDHCAEPPPSRVKGHVAKEVGAMLAEGIAYERVRQGLAEWASRGQSPATLASFVNAVGNTKPRNSRQAETDGLFERAAKRMGVAQ